MPSPDDPVGILSLVVMRDPDPDKYFKLPSAAYRALYSDLEGGEWGTLFYQVFNCPDAGDEPFSPEGDLGEWQEKFSERFRLAIPDYPMLGRMWDLNIYISYQPDEVARLCEECIRVKALTTNERALTGLNKLINGCDEALRSNDGLLLVPD